MYYEQGPEKKYIYGPCLVSKFGVARGRKTNKNGLEPTPSPTPAPAHEVLVSCFLKFALLSRTERDLCRVAVYSTPFPTPLIALYMLCSALSAWR